MLDFIVSHRFVLTLLLLIALFVGWPSDGPEEFILAQPSAQRHVPDYLLEDFTLTMTGDDGLPRYRLSATKMTHYPDSDTAELENPRMEFLLINKGLWVIKADKALAEKNGEIVHMQGQVSIYRDGGDKVLALKTEVLDVYVTDEYAVTDQQVIIQQSYGSTRALGMRIDFRQRHLYLKAQVRGEYAIPES